MEETKMKNESYRAKHAYLYGLPMIGMYSDFYECILNEDTKIGSLNEVISDVDVSDDHHLHGKAYIDLRNGPVVLYAPHNQARDYTITVRDLFSEEVVVIESMYLESSERSFLFSYIDDLELNQVEYEEVVPLVSKLVEVMISVDVEDENTEEAALYLSMFTLNNTKEGSTHSLPLLQVDSAKHWFETLSNLIPLVYEFEDETEILYYVRESTKYSEDTLLNAMSEAVEELEKGRTLLKQPYFLRSIEWIWKEER